jgi:putative flippase GtrA
MILRQTLPRAFASFALVGLVATAVQYLILVLSVEKLALSPVLGSTLGFVTSAGLNYWLNYHFTFRSRNPHAGAAGRFAVVALSGLGLNALVMMLLGHVPGLRYIVSQLVATALVLAWNFLGNSVWTFAQRRARSGDAIIGAGK